jgi:hypothetical protein
MRRIMEGREHSEHGQSLSRRPPFGDGGWGEAGGA